MGHSLHQILVGFPIGLLVTATVFDLIQLAAGGAAWTLAARYMIAAGVVSGLAAAVFGFIDYSAIPVGTRARRIARWHGLSSAAVLACYAASWYLRHSATDATPLAAVAFAVAGVLIVAAAGWLGGELVSRMGIGVMDGAHVDAGARPAASSGFPQAAPPADRAAATP